MGKPDFKSPRSRNILTKKHPISRTKSAPLRSSANIRVVVRVRPPNEREHGDNSKIIVKLIDEKVLVFDPKISSQAFFYHGIEQKGRDLLRKANKDMQFMFDRVFGFDSTNNAIFENTTKDLIKCLMDGFNCSVFAYGATGAGKTHTMLGHTDNPGITFLTMAELFHAKQELCSERNFELAISYLEVYNETVQDLLNPGSPLQLRDDGKYGVTVAGIKVKKITNPDELFSLLAQGNSNRTQHPTDANAESSRSHAVFQVYVQMEFKASREMRTAKLSMIDLAGSERGSATGFGGARFTEGANINKSLLALGNCINSLADGQRYVPYRDSKLTRLLKDSLGGNCQTVMIANISPSSLSFEDTYNTLKYATRAKKIKSDIKRNVVNVELHVGEYVKIVTELKRENEELKKETEQLKVELKREKEKQQQQQQSIISVQTANVLTPINTKRNLDSTQLSGTLSKLIEDRRKILDRMHNIEVSERNVLLRRQLKDEANSRLSGLLTNSPEKEEAHQRLGKTIDRFQRQVESLQSELGDIKANKVQNEAKMVQLMKKYPELEMNIALEHEKLLSIETQYQMDVMEKERGLMREELKSRASIMEKTCKMLRSCYMQLRGHGFVSDALAKDYQALVNHLQGRRNISWEDAGDSGMSSSTSSSLTDEETRQNVKRKLDVGSSSCSSTTSNGSMDVTYLLEEDEVEATTTTTTTTKVAKVKVCSTDEIMAKVSCKPPLSKKRVDSSHPLKENKRIPNNATTKTNSTIFKKTYLNSKQEVFKKPPFRT